MIQFDIDTLQHSFGDIRNLMNPECRLHLGEASRKRIEKKRGIGYTDSMFNLREFEKKINGIETRRNVPMAQRTSFHVGGNADLVIFPASEMELQRVLRLLSAERTPYFVLGGGTNLIVADKGIREPVIATEKLKRIAVDGCRI